MKRRPSPSQNEVGGAKEAQVDETNWRPRFTRGFQQTIVIALACSLAALTYYSSWKPLSQNSPPIAVHIARRDADALGPSGAAPAASHLPRGPGGGSFLAAHEEAPVPTGLRGVSTTSSQHEAVSTTSSQHEASSHYVTEEQALHFDEFVQNFTTDEVLLWAARQFPGRLMQFSSFGISGMVIIDKLAKLGLLKEVPAVSIDTLHLFDETYKHIRSVSRNYSDMNLHTYYPKGFSVGQQFKFDYVYGDDLWTYEFDQYTYLTKVEPTTRALHDMDPAAWITGRRRAQGDLRSDLRIIEFDDGRLKINPMAAWTSQEVWSYIKKDAVPYNPLHDRGYTSIGDRMNTRATKKGEGEREGRFQFAGNSKKTECGMHENRAKWKAQQEAAEKQHKAFDIPKLPCPDVWQLHPETFEQVVLKNKKAVLVEFYSPLCGHCQHFGPIYAEVVKTLKGAKHVLAARYDLFNHTVPEVAKKAGIDIDGYPSIWLIRADPASGKRIVAEYSGEKDWKAKLDLIRWVRSQLGILVGDL